MLRPIAVVATGTLASRLTGFVRDAMVAALLGAGAASDAFLVAFQLVTLIRRLLTEGALNAAFVPAWLRIRDERGDAGAAAFAGRALGTIGLSVTLLALLLGVAAPLVIALIAPGFVGDDTLASAVIDARLMLPYLAFAGPVAVMIALANAQRRVAFSALAPVLFNTALIAVMGVLILKSADASHAALIVAGAVGIAGFLQLAMLAGAGRAAARATPLRAGVDTDMRALFARALPGMVASAGPQLLIVTGAVVASRAPSAVSWLYFASRLIDLPLGIISTIAGAVLLPEAAHAARRDDAQALRTAQAHGVGVALALALPAAAGLFVLAEPIVRVVFARGAFGADDAAATAQALQALALGLPAQAVVKALSPTFYARGDTLTPMIATLSGVAAALPAALALFPVAGPTGIAAAVTLGGWIMALILAWRLRFTMREARLLRIILAALAMAAALEAARAYCAPVDAIRLALLIGASLGLYGASLVLTGAIRLGDLRGLRARGKGTRTQDVSK